MANLSNINNILRTGSLGVGINRDPLGVLEVSSATKSGIKMFNTGASGKTYETYVDASGNYIIYDEDADRNDLVINSSGNSTFAGIATINGAGAAAAGSINLVSEDPFIRLYDNGSGSTTDKKKWDIRAIGYAGYEMFEIRTVNDANNVFSTKLSIAHNGNATFAGNVEASGLLTVKGDGADIRIRQADDALSIDLGSSGSGFGYLDMYNNGGSIVNKLNTVGDSYILGGNVGIGTSSPQRLLQLRSTNEATGIFLERTSNYGFVQYNQIVGSVETYHLGFVNNNTFSSDILVANESGNVGIGTDTPFGKLSVNVTAGAPSSSGNMTNGLTVHNTNGGRAIQLGVNESGGYTYLQSAYVNNAGVAQPMAFFTGATEKMRITSAGLVEIKSNSTNQASFEQTLSIAKQLGNNGVAIPVAYVDHTHSLDVTVIVKQSTSHVSVGKGSSVVAYGSGSASLSIVRGSGNVSSVSIAYLNTNPNGQNYVLTVTPTFNAGNPPIAYITIRGNSTSAISEY